VSQIIDDPISREAYNCFQQAEILQQQSNPTEALKYFLRTIDLKPEWTEPYYKAGYILYKHGKLREAVVIYNNAIKINPEADFYYNLATILAVQGKIKEALEQFRKAIELKSNSSNFYSNMLFSMQYNDNFNQDYWKEILSLFSKSCNDIPKFKNYNNLFIPEKKLKIGYISGDFRQHSCYFFIKPLLEKHNQEKFTVYCYSSVKQPDNFTEELKTLTNCWRDISGMEEKAAAELIHSDSIDILIDLAGHSAENSLRILAWEPAPLQITWLGFSGSTGLQAIKYRISDKWLTPTDNNEFYTEKIWNIPRVSHSLLPFNDLPEIKELPLIKNGYITFGSFNNISKISDTTLELWSSVLNALPESKLIIKAQHVNDKGVYFRLIDAFKKYGVNPFRIEFVNPVAGIYNHLDYYNNIDIVLDTFPHNGVTTTAEALIMGVPVITLKGNRTATRYSFSFLSTIKLSALATSDKKEFVKIALKLAQKPKYLQKLRNELRERMYKSKLFNSEDFAYNMERAYKKMWKQLCREK